MKLCIVHINQEGVSGPYASLLSENFNRIKRDDTVIEHKYVKCLKRATDTIVSYFIQLNRTEIIQCFRSAAKEGYDGAMVACSGDPGVAEAQEIVDIPIVGPMEAAMFMACMYGPKFGILTVHERRWAEYCEELTVRSGIHSRLAGVQRISIPSTEAFTKGFMDKEWMGRELKEKAGMLIDAGANSVVIGSAGLSTIAASAGITTLEDCGAPIFDCLSIGLKTLETRVDLVQKLHIPPVSRVGSHEQVKEEDIVRVNKLFGLA
jgi:allantoin racemase